MSAVFSPCARYRYRLERSIDRLGPVAAVIMINPSTADAEADDATVRRVVGFAAKFGWSRVIVGNLFAFRATDVRVLGVVDDPVGPDNFGHLGRIVDDTDLVLVAWGSLAKLPPSLRGQWRTFHAAAVVRGLPLHCLGVTSDGHPRHPLMLSYRSELVNWQCP
jgi:hypothetical protein